MSQTIMADTWVIATATLVGGALGAGGGFIAVWNQNRTSRIECKSQLKHHLHYVLTRIGSIGEIASQLQVPLGSRPDILEEIIELRALYERMSQYGMYLKSRAYDARLRTFIMEAGISAKLALANDSEAQKLMGNSNRGPTDSRRLQELIAGIQAAKAGMGAWKEQAQHLLQDLDGE